MTEIRVLMKMIRHLLAPSEEFDAGFENDCDYHKLYLLAQKHSYPQVIPLYFESVQRDCPSPEAFEKCRSELMTVCLHEMQKKSIAMQSYALLNQHEIAFLPMKGEVIRPLYTEELLRPSCDIDILVHQEDYEKTKALFLQNGFTVWNDAHGHDIELKKKGVNFELHFSIREDNPRIDRVLNRVWDYAERHDGFEYRESNAYFAYHLVAHAYRHFLSGGCGLKPFVDLYVLKQNAFYEEKELEALLKESDLIPFYHGLEALMRVWLEDEEYDDLTSAMEEFVLNGGNYGTSENLDSVKTVQRNGKFRWLFQRVFPSSAAMKKQYPFLARRPINRYLLPVFYGYRFFERKEQSRAGKAMKILRQDQNTVSSVGLVLDRLKIK